MAHLLGEQDGRGRVAAQPEGADPEVVGMRG